MPDRDAPRSPVQDPFESTTMDSGPRSLPYTKACPTCRHFDCVCSIKAAHVEGCKYRAAATTTIAIECDEHGSEICEVCHPCTCADIPDDDDTPVDELEDEISVVMAKPEPPQRFSAPTSEMLTDPLFGAILGVIRRWEITVPGTHNGHCIPTGDHARAILEAITPVIEVEYVKKGGG